MVTALSVTNIIFDLYFLTPILSERSPSDWVIKKSYRKLKIAFEKFQLDCNDEIYCYHNIIIFRATKYNVKRGVNLLERQFST